MATGSAFAADLPASPTQTYGGYYQTPQYNWGGLYVGINGGYGFGTSSWTGATGATGNFAVRGPLAGGTAGLNWQMANGIVFGIEADGDWASLEGNSSNALCSAATAGATCETRTNVLVTGRGRLGYAFQRVLLYGTAGAAWSGIAAGLKPPGTYDSTFDLGWTAGGGLEYAIGEQWTAKIEYLYVDLGVTQCQSPNCGAGVPFGVPLTENLVRAGVNFRFAPW